MSLILRQSPVRRASIIGGGSPDGTMTWDIYPAPTDIFTPASERTVDFVIGASSEIIVKGSFSDGTTSNWELAVAPGSPALPSGVSITDGHNISWSGSGTAGTTEGITMTVTPLPGGTPDESVPFKMRIMQPDGTKAATWTDHGLISMTGSHNFTMTGAKDMRAAYTNSLVYVCGGDNTASGAKREIWAFNPASSPQSWPEVYPHCGPSGDVQPVCMDEFMWVPDDSGNLVWGPGVNYFNDGTDCVGAATLIRNHDSAPANPKTGNGMNRMTFNVTTNKWALNADIADVAVSTWQSLMHWVNVPGKSYYLCCATGAASLVATMDKTTFAITLHDRSGTDGNRWGNTKICVNAAGTFAYLYTRYGEFCSIDTTTFQFRVLLSGLPCCMGSNGFTLTEWNEANGWVELWLPNSSNGHGYMLVLDPGDNVTPSSAHWYACTTNSGRGIHSVRVPATGTFLFGGTGTAEGGPLGHLYKVVTS